MVVVSAAVFVLFIPTWMLEGYANGGRVGIGVFVPLLLALPHLRQVLGGRSRTVNATLLLWSAPFWAFAAAISLAAPAHTRGDHLPGIFGSSSMPARVISLPASPARPAGTPPAQSSA
jgi:hypothetical protein